MVQIKRKVTIRTKHSQVEQPLPPENNGGDNKSGKKWIWLIILAVIILVAFLAYRSCQSDSIPAESQNDKEMVDSSAVEEATQPKTPPENNDSVDEKDSEEEENVENSNAGSEQNIESTPTSADNDIELPDKTVEDKAKEVIRGIYGNGSVRKQKLGTEYTEIQNKVNEMYRNGDVR